MERHSFRIVLDDSPDFMHYNKKLHPVVTELFIKCQKLNISLVFITQLYFSVPKDVRQNTKGFFIMNIPKRRELEEIAQEVTHLILTLET